MDQRTDRLPVHLVYKSLLFQQNQAVMANVHYIEGVPINSLVVVPRKLSGRVRKPRTMHDAAKLKFSDLKSLLDKRLHSGAKISASSLPNLHSALKAFLAERGLQEDSPVGSSLRASYYKNLHAHVQKLKDEGRPLTYISPLADRFMLSPVVCSLSEVDIHF